MRNILLLFSLCLLFVSCDNNDDNDGGQDAIIGTWRYYKSFEDGVEIPLDDCETQERFTFNADGGLSYEYYELNASNECVLDESFSDASWTNDGQSVYTMTVEGVGSSETILFEGNTFYYEYTEVENISDPVTVTYREVYIRVE